MPANALRPSSRARRSRAAHADPTDATGRLEELQVPPGNRPEALRGDRPGQHGVLVNEQWRICFVCRDGEGWEVEIADCLSGAASNAAIDREGLDRFKVDFADVASGWLSPPVHPGAILRGDFLKPMELCVYRLARDIKVSRPWLDEIALGRRAVTTDTAPRLARHFGTTPEFWINLQTRYDPDVAERTVRQKIDREVVPRAV